MTTPQRVTLLGATGSIGQSALRVIEHASARFSVVALTAQEKVGELIALAHRTRPEFVAIGNPAHYAALKAELGSLCEVAAGPEALLEAAARASDIVVAGIVGAAGLAPTLAALAPGRKILLANKECLVCAGPLFLARVRETGAVLLPIDSEHNAIFQLFDPAQAEAVESVTLTASGGPFREWSLERMRSATPAQAVAHPTWNMGAKISVDSATMMNKGLETIEAYHLFPLRPEQIRVVVHPQSAVHSFVSYVDGSTLAHFSGTDMSVPIAHALNWPARLPCPTPALDVTRLGNLTFEPADETRFPALRLAREALIAGPAAQLALNAANEVAVAAFLSGRLGFTDIAALVERVLSTHHAAAPETLEAVLAMDAEVRTAAHTELSARFAAYS